MSFLKQNFEFIKPSFPEFTPEEFDVLRKCAYILIHKSIQPNLHVQLAIQYLCAVILQHENLTELMVENDET